MSKIAIFVSGSGSNAENIFNFFSANPEIDIDCILCNNPKAFAIQRAERLGIPCFIFNREQFTKSTEVVEILTSRQIDLVVLAGFLWLVPKNLINAFPNAIINIHPALLPKYGGKGMYGMKVHEAVVANKEKESGITIHYVNEKYDEGNIIFQAKCEVNQEDTAEDVANKIHSLEYEHFPKIIEKTITNLNSKE